MKKIFTLFVIAVTFISLSYARKVDEKTAKIVGSQFFIGRAAQGKMQNISDVSLRYTSYAPKTALAPSSEPIVYFYVFNVNSSEGFVIVSGDDIVEPILGYSNQGAFDADHIPPHVAAWLKGYEDQIQFAISQNMQATSKIKADWELYKTTTNPKPFFKATQGIGPLVQTTWNQSPYYNALCPYDNQTNDRAVTGCVATAMAQVLKYWNFPATGAGFHSYNDPKYGTLSADFGSTTYDWNSMPLALNGPNSAVATLMYHCGVSVDMTYGVAATGGSAAYVISSQSPVTNCSEYALKTYFGYPATLHGEARQSYSDAIWKGMMKTDLDASRPLIYAGFGSGGGHCFVCDGYDNNDMFHFNWGWQGQFDGYFDINALNPEGVGTGGGTGGFNSGQQAIFGVQGSGGGGGGGSSTLQIYAPVNISASPIYYGNAFTVNTDIANMAASGTFTGDFCAAIFDNNLAFVDFVQVLTNMTLPAQSHYINGLTFSSTGLFTMLPGDYTIAVYSRTAGGNWILLPDGSGGNTNVIQVSVINPNDIEMYANIAVSPGTTLTNGQAVSVHLDVANFGTTNFSGTWDVSLYNLDGSFAATIQALTGQSLPAGNHYINGLTFSTATLSVPPGTYLMALQYLPAGGDWTLTGSTSYQNPIQVTVQEGTLAPDIYESNNTLAQSYALPFTFTGNTASTSTNGSNCNNGTDYDFYKITLDPGFSYSIGAVVNDANHGGGQTYTLDAIWTYSTDGGSWSPTFDDVDPNSILVNNGGTVYFQVSPKFTGTTGTYVLVLNITKNPLGIGEYGNDAFRVYPNPAHDYLNIAPSSQQQWPTVIRLSTVDGREVMKVDSPERSDRIQLEVAGIQSGLYILQIFTTDGVISKQVVITR